MRVKSLGKVNIDLLHGSSGYPPLYPSNSVFSDDTSDSEEELAPSLVPSPSSDRLTFKVHSQQMFSNVGDIKLCAVSDRGSRLAFTAVSGNFFIISMIYNDSHNFSVGTTSFEKKSPYVLRENCMSSFTFFFRLENLFFCWKKIVL